MYAVRPRKIPNEHWTVKNNQSGGGMKMRKQRGDIAVSAEDLGIVRNQSEIQMRQQMISAIPSPRADYCLYLWQTEHLVELIYSSAHSSGKEQFAIEDAFGEDGIKAKLP